MGTVTTFKTLRVTPSLDGRVLRGGTDQTLSAIRSGSGTSTSSVGDIIELNASTTTNQFATLVRTITLFDTSPIPVGSTIDSATITLNITEIDSGLGTTTLELVSSNSASTSVLAAADYSTLGSTSFSSTSWGSLFVGFNILTLNSSGLSNINIGGISRFGFVLGWDLNNNFTGTWASLTDSGVFWTVNNALLNVSYHFTSPALAITGIGSTISSITSMATA